MYKLYVNKHETTEIQVNSKKKCMLEKQRGL